MGVERGQAWKSDLVQADGHAGTDTQDTALTKSMYRYIQNCFNISIQLWRPNLKLNVWPAAQPFAQPFGMLYGSTFAPRSCIGTL